MEGTATDGVAEGKIDGIVVGYWFGIVLELKDGVSDTNIVGIIEAVLWNEGIDVPSLVVASEGTSVGN